MTQEEGKIHIYKQSDCFRCGRVILLSDWNRRWIHEHSLVEECALKRPTADPGNNEVYSVDRWDDVIA